MKYPKERKKAILKKMLPPHSKSIGEIAKEEDICEATLYHRRQAARAEGRLQSIRQQTHRAGAVFEEVLQIAARRHPRGRHR